MRYKVKLRYFQSENTGDWGFAHANTFDHDSPFDPFYDASGIFHDVFEHYFEGTKYFCGNNQNNAYGEMVATAHKLYFYNELNVNAFRHRRFGGYITDWKVDTSYILYEKYLDEYEQFPCHNIKLPYQRPESAVDWVVREYQEYLREKLSIPKRRWEHQQIANAYRLGYKMAAKKWPSEGHWEDLSKINMLNEFIDFWHNFTTINKGKLYIEDEHAYGLRYLEFTIDTRKPSWRCRLIDEAHNTYNLNKLTTY